MKAPASFDYLRKGPSREEVFSSFRVPERLRTAFRALCLSCMFALCACLFEGARLRQAVAIENVDRARFAQQVKALKDARIYEKRVRELLDLDDRIRRIAASGTWAARRLAALARDLPQNVWITAITPDSGGITLDGRARNLTALSDTLVRLNGDPLLEKPSLLSAQMTGPATAQIPLQFTLHLSGSARRPCD